MHSEVDAKGAADPGRRQFLKLGLWSGLALATVSTTAMLSGCSSPPSAASYRLLREGDLVLFRALIPAVLAGALPTGPAQAKAVDDTLHSLDQLLFYSSRASHKQLQQLFDLLTFPATRIIVAGVRHDWAAVTPDDVEAFLQRWKTSGVGMLRAGYKGLCQMIEMAWYLQPQSWPAIGYAPPVKAL